jgi:hypothetical protein
MTFVEKIKSDIENDMAGIASEGGTAPSEAAIAKSLFVASVLASLVRADAYIQYAAFVEDDGGISIVLQSLAQGGRINFRIKPDGSSIEAVVV